MDTCGPSTLQGSITQWKEGEAAAQVPVTREDLRALCWVQKLVPEGHTQYDPICRVFGITESRTGEQISGCQGLGTGAGGRGCVYKRTSVRSQRVLGMFSVSALVVGPGNYRGDKTM